MVQETIFQHWVVAQFILPFLLIFVIVFGILQKTKLLGEGKNQLDAIVAFIIGLIFVGAIFPKEVVGNLILFLTVAIIVMFVALLLWGFVSGGEMKGDILKTTGMKWTVGIVVVVAVLIGLLWAAGIDNTAFGFLFGQSWSDTFWTNVLFIVVIAVVLAIVLRKKS